jgi:hypothetical protein
LSEWEPRLASTCFWLLARFYLTGNDGWMVKTRQGFVLWVLGQFLKSARSEFLRVWSSIVQGVMLLSLVPLLTGKWWMDVGKQIARLSNFDVWTEFLGMQSKVVWERVWSSWFVMCWLLLSYVCVKVCCHGCFVVGEQGPGLVSLLFFGHEVEKCKMKF